MSAPDTIHAQALRIVDRLALAAGADAVLRQDIHNLLRAAAHSMPLPDNVARCVGEHSEEDGEYHWREGCDDCLRRTSPGGRVTVKPPAIIAFECEYRIGPGEVVG